MVLYDADLKEAGVARLDKLFTEGPYATRRSENGQNIAAFIPAEGMLEFMAYDPKTIVLFYEPMENLPEEVKQDICQRLEQVKALEKIVGKARGELFKYEGTEIF